MNRYIEFVAVVILWRFVALAAQPLDEQVTYVFPDEDPVISLSGWKTSSGDSMQWSRPDYDDTHWPEEIGAGLWVVAGAAGKGVRWYRKRIFIPESIDTLNMLALYQLAAVAASEMYWDGRLIARNGQPGVSRLDEVAGRSGRVFIVPPALTGPGEHLIAVRVSNFQTFSGLVQEPLQLGYFSSLKTSLYKRAAVFAFLAGIFLFTALFHIAVFLGYRDRWPYAIFSMFCLACAVFIVIELLRRHVGINLADYYLLAAINDIPWFFMMTLLPVFFMFEFAFPRKELLTTIIAVVAFFVVALPRLVISGLIPVSWLEPLITANQIHAYLTILISGMVSFWALLRRKIGCLTSTAGLLAFLAGVVITNRLQLDYGWALGFAIMIVFLTASLSNQMAQRNREYQEALLRSTRLELELLKRHIQPHFLLNSLNSIIAWLEEDPRTASVLVNALAEELRMLMTFAKERAVALRDEIELCRVHLKVMSLRYEKQYEFKTENIRGEEQVPPLVIHTLVENGLTHGYSEKDAGVFVLRRQEHDGVIRLSLFNDGRVSAPGKPLTEGTGMRYVKSRLQEMYPGRWTLESGPVRDGWEAVIGVRGMNV